MPELPEVTTTVNGLKKKIVGLTIRDVWTDISKKKVIEQFKNTIKSESFFETFKTLITNKKILSVERRAKNILIHLSNNKTILIHLKMTGHLLVGRYVYNKKENKWHPDKNERESLHDPYNRFVHVVFTLSDGRCLVFCDSRKFGKVTIYDKNDMVNHQDFIKLGPEPLAENFTKEEFLKVLNKKNLSNKNIKTVLMDQNTIAGIGNIYSDEILFSSAIHPESKIPSIPKKNMIMLYKYMREILQKGIDFGGDSMSDYRDTDGNKGKFQYQHKVYQKKGEKCMYKNCKGVIIRKVINGRSAHYCDTHQIKFI